MLIVRFYQFSYNFLEIVLYEDNHIFILYFTKNHKNKIIKNELQM